MWSHYMHKGTTLSHLRTHTAASNMMDEVKEEFDAPSEGKLVFNLNLLISACSHHTKARCFPLFPHLHHNGDYKIYRVHGTVPEAGWTGPHYPNVSTPGGLRAKEQCGGCLYNILRSMSIWPPSCICIIMSNA